ncbi:hypothetical protein SSABA_v1c03090 [Spiroplasma sabaudiense Ar-1343]|uniref:Uncharacterized protein n=1 Tax=Spiroplasma sabaudiense Ar-1343 TaxID=1276257 RepID=W6A9S6_9MOLU|nr:hypothetical protein [Spiroplasma sabaudiense]AHI53721.1 hypothetical protein SSABA_v1c03090 [Spiroplasma sabaudiense Ar-1343]
MSNKIIQINKNQIEKISFFKDPWYLFSVFSKNEIIIKFLHWDLESGISQLIEMCKKNLQTLEIMMSLEFQHFIIKEFSVLQLDQAYLKMKEKIFFDEKKNFTKIFTIESPFWIDAVVNLLKIKPIIFKEKKFILEINQVANLDVINFWTKIKTSAIKKNIENKK